jgi:hypothetical protein
MDKIKYKDKLKDKANTNSIAIDVKYESPINIDDYSNSIDIDNYDSPIDLDDSSNFIDLDDNTIKGTFTSIENNKLVIDDNIDVLDTIRKDTDDIFLEILNRCKLILRETGEYLTPKELKDIAMIAEGIRAGAENRGVSDAVNAETLLMQLQKKFGEGEAYLIEPEIQQDIDILTK